MTKQTIKLILISCLGIAGLAGGMRVGIDHLTAVHEVQTWEQINVKLANNLK
jgi:hypothetical protein